MKNILELPSWITEMIAAVLGFLARTIYDTIVNKKKIRISTVNRLKEFENLLKIGQSIFHDQMILVRRLYKSLSDNHELFKNGYSEGFLKSYDQMNEEQKEIFEFIRGITENSIYSLNDKLNQWADKNEMYTLTTKKSTIADEFDKDIHTLREHLQLWFAKYNSIFKNNPKYCLVFLGDENSHGVAFPQSIRDSVKKMIDFVDGKHL